MDEHSAETKVISLLCGFAAVTGVLMVLVIFVNRKDDTVSISAACFAVAGLVSVMPWQLAQIEEKKNVALLRKVGAQMTLGALIFLSATVLKFSQLNVSDLKFWGDKEKWEHLFWLGSFITFVFASVCFAWGFVKFVQLLLCQMFCHHTNE